MDLGGATGPATTASPESTVVADKSGVIVVEESEKEATAPGNGSAPDSTAAKEKNEQHSLKTKDVPMEASSVAKKSVEEVANKPTEQQQQQQLKEDESKTATKQAVTTTTTTTVPSNVADAKKVKPVGHSSETSNKNSSSSSSSNKGKEAEAASVTEEDDMENDDLLLRLEALEKGEDPDLVRVEKKKDADSNHQNGLMEKSKPATEEALVAKQKEADKEVEAPTKTAEPVAAESSQKVKPNEGTSTAVAGGKGESVEAKSTEAVSSNAKRKHPLGEQEVCNEPQTKKIHVSDVADGRELAAEAAKAIPEQSVASSATTQSDKPSPSSSEPPAPSPSEEMEVTDAQPPSVEKMDVDGSPEPETSSSDNLETTTTLPDTEPNTESDEKQEEISSSVAEEPTRSDCANKSGKSDHSNVSSSSDDKRTGTGETSAKANQREGEVSASISLPTPSEEEAMDVDEDETDMAESTTSAGASGVAVVPVAVVEPPCVKKVAYLCYDDDKTDLPGANDPAQKTAVATPAKPPVAVATNSAAAATVATKPAAASTSSKEKTAGKAIADSTPKASSSVAMATEKTTTGGGGGGGGGAGGEVVVVESSNNKQTEKPSSVAPSTATTTSVVSSAKVLDESSIVESSSQPSSSSDSTKQPSEHRLLSEQKLREAVHRSGLLAKASSTPNSSSSSSSSAVLARSSSPLTPKATTNPVTTSAVSSSNVYSSTPIHANFVAKVSSGNVSKITNPPSSIETSRVEADETATTTIISDQSVSISVPSEEKETMASSSANTTATTTATASTTKSSPSVATHSKPAAASAATTSGVKASSPKKDLLKREESNSTSSSSSLKTTDLSEVDSCAAPSAMNTADEINMYTSNARKFNGISSTSDGSEVLDIKSTDAQKTYKTVKLEADSKAAASLSTTTTTQPKLDLSGAISPSTPTEQQYEISVWYDGKDLQFLSVERIHGKAETSHSFEPCTTAGTTAVTQDALSSLIDSSSKQSSTTTNGSVSSLGPFSLAETRPVTAQSSDSSSTSMSGPVAAATVGSGEQQQQPPLLLAKSSTTTSTMSVPGVKQTVIGPTALCDLIIEEFKKLRRTFAPDDEQESQTDVAPLPNTPKNSTATARGGQQQQRSGGGTGSVTKKSVAARGQKRAKAAESEDDEEGSEPRTPRVVGQASTKQPAAKKAKSNESPTVSSTATTPKPKAAPEPKQFDICCLARWTDRKYYAGRVTNFRGDNKYVVLFEDGCSKTLSRDIIVFGENGMLPILNHSIHALTGGDTYEPAIVEEIKRGGGGGEGGGDSGEVVYAVRTATSALEVTATDIYLTDEQAKWIHNSLKDRPDPMQQLLQQQAGSGASAHGAEHGAGAGDGPAGDAHLSGSQAAAEHAPEAGGGDKNARSTRSKRGGTGDKTMATPGTPEAGYSGGVGKKGRRGRRKQLPAPEPNISECSDASDGYEDEVPPATTPLSPEAGLDAVDGVQPELQRTEQESELAKMILISQCFENDYSKRGDESLQELLGPIPAGCKTLFRNKHFLLSCTIPLKATTASCNGDGTASKYKQFSNVPFIKNHLRRQIEAGGGKVYQFFEDVPKNKYKLCKLIAPRPSTTALYVQCLACDIPVVSHEWIIQCCQLLMLVDHKPYSLPCGWSFLEKCYIDWDARRSGDKRKTSSSPFASVSINVASLCKDFNDFWSRVCKLAGATVRLIKTETDVTDNLTGYLLTDQEFPELIKIKAARNGLLVVSTVWVVQCLILGRVCHPKSHEKLTQIYQEEDY